MACEHHITGCCVREEQQRVVSSDVPCIRDAEQGATEETLEGAAESTALCRIQKGSRLSPLRFPGLTGLLSKVIVPFYPLILPVKTSVVECRMTFQEFIE